MDIASWGLFTFAVAFCFYFLPWVVAMLRRVDRIGGIVALNLLLGWTGLGWLIALIWAFSAETRGQAQLRNMAYMAMARGLDPRFGAPPPSPARAPYVEGPMVGVGRSFGSALRRLRPGGADEKAPSIRPRD